MEEKEAEQEMKTGNFSKARELYDTLLRRNKRKVQFLLGKADCLVLEGRLTDSLQFYSEALKTGKVRPDRLFCLISGLAQVVDQETANISSSPSDESTILQCGDCTGILSEPITVPCGHTFCKLCLEKQGSKSCTRCGESTSHVSLKTNVVLRDILGKCFESELEATRLRLEGNCFHRKKQSEEAITKYLEAEQLNNSDHLVQSNLACVLTSLERFEEAVLKANRACELQPSWPKGYYRKGCALLGLNKKIEAVVAFIHCLARDPENKSVKKSLAKVLHELLSESTSSSNCDMDMAETDASEDTDLCLQKLERILDLLEPSKTEYTSEDAGSEPNIKKLKLDKTCCVEDLECTLCCRLFYEPVTTPCGHVFCRSCLNCNLDHRPSCPICRFSLRKYLAERNQNITVAVSCLIETHLKEEYQERKRQHEAEMEKLASVASDTKEDVPIFVCTLAFPSLPCPLHIFEPRYRLMMRQCMESGSQQFGMVLPDEEKCFADYGVMLEIRELQYLPDGRSFVDCIGGRRFKVLERGMQNGYHTAKVEWIKDEQIPEEEISEVKALHQEVYNEAKTWFTDLPLLARRRIMNTFPDMPNCDPEPQNLPQGPTWMWWLLSVCPLSPQAQLEFMAMPSLKARLRKLQQLLASLRAREMIF